MCLSQVSFYTTINLNYPSLSSTCELACMHLHLLLIFYGWQKEFSKYSPPQTLLDDELIVRAQYHLFTHIWDISIVLLNPPVLRSQMDEQIRPL